MEIQIQEASHPPFGAAPKRPRQCPLTDYQPPPIRAIASLDGLSRARNAACQNAANAARCVGRRRQRKGDGRAGASGRVARVGRRRRCPIRYATSAGTIGRSPRSRTTAFSPEASMPARIRSVTSPSAFRGGTSRCTSGDCLNPARSLIARRAPTVCAAGILVVAPVRRRRLVNCAERCHRAAGVDVRSVPWLQRVPKIEPLARGRRTGRAAMEVVAQCRLCLPGGWRT
jgi:hypothetical protein